MEAAKYDEKRLSMSEPVKIKFTKDGKPDFIYEALKDEVGRVVADEMKSSGSEAVAVTGEMKGKYVDPNKATVDAKKVDPDDALECDVKSEMGGNWGASSRGEALSNLARNAVNAAGAKGLTHKLKSDLHAHASNLFSKAADEHVKAGGKAEDYPARDAKSMADRHSKISAEMMK
jgi:hypothetical protein